MHFFRHETEFLAEPKCVFMLSRSGVFGGKKWGVRWKISDLTQSEGSILGALHDFALARSLVVDTAEVQNAVNDDTM